MKLNYNLSILYDILCYDIIFLNKEVILQVIDRLSKHDKIPLEYYERLRFEIKADPLPSLYPFFHYDGKFPCPVSKFF